MPSKNLREITSLRLASVLRFATNNIDIYGMPRVEFKIIRMARFWSPSSCSVWALDYIRLLEAKKTPISARDLCTLHYPHNTSSQHLVCKRTQPKRYVTTVPVRLICVEQKTMRTTQTFNDVQSTMGVRLRSAACRRLTATHRTNLFRLMSCSLVVRMGKKRPIRSSSFIVGCFVL